MIFLNSNEFLTLSKKCEYLVVPVPLGERHYLYTDCLGVLIKIVFTGAEGSPQVDLFLFFVFTNLQSCASTSVDYHSFLVSF